MNASWTPRLNAVSFFSEFQPASLVFFHVHVHFHARNTHSTTRDAHTHIARASRIVLHLGCFIARSPPPAYPYSPALTHSRTMEAPLSEQLQQPTQSQQLAMTANEEQGEELQDYEVSMYAPLRLTCALPRPAFQRNRAVLKHARTSHEVPRTRPCQMRSPKARRAVVPSSLASFSHHSLLPRDTSLLCFSPCRVALFARRLCRSLSSSSTNCSSAASPPRTSRYAHQRRVHIRISSLARRRPPFVLLPLHASKRAAVLTPRNFLSLLCPTTESQRRWLLHRQEPPDGAQEDAHRRQGPVRRQG